LELTSTYPIYEAPDFKFGGVKLIHFLKRRPELSQEEFANRWRAEYAPVIVKQMRRLGVLRKYQHNPQLSLNAEIFKGTLFERGGVGLYAGIEEIWLNSLQDLAVLRNDADAYPEIRSAASKLVADEGTFSMVTTERVIYDYSVPGKESPLPAVLRSGSLEALIDAQGYKSWNVP
jgi:EthD domain